MMTSMDKYLCIEPCYDSWILCEKCDAGHCIVLMIMLSLEPNSAGLCRGRSWWFLWNEEMHVSMEQRDSDLHGAG